MTFDQLPPLLPPAVFNTAAAQTTILIVGVHPLDMIKEEINDFLPHTLPTGTLLGLTDADQFMSSLT